MKAHRFSEAPFSLVVQAWKLSARTSASIVQLPGSDTTLTSSTATTSELPPHQNIRRLQSPPSNPCDTSLTIKPSVGPSTIFPLYFNLHQDTPAQLLHSSAHTHFTLARNLDQTMILLHTHPSTPDHRNQQMVIDLHLPFFRGYIDEAHRRYNRKD